VLPVAALALACGRQDADESAVLADDLKRDLQAASSSGVELAATARDFKQTQVVSMLESPQTSAPVRKRTVRKPVAQPLAANEPEEKKAPDPAPENKMDVAEPTPAEETPAPSIDTPTQVAVSPRPTPVGAAPAPVDAGAGGVGGGSAGGGLGGVGEAIGTIIGVVVTRGGGGGIDHCDPRTDRRRPPNGPVAYPGTIYPGANGGWGGAVNNPIPPRGGRGFPSRRF
jgi:hypothetical protein